VTRPQAGRPTNLGSIPAMGNRFSFSFSVQTAVSFRTSVQWALGVTFPGERRLPVTSI
jgi:hypothetical protein